MCFEWSIFKKAQFVLTQQKYEESKFKEPPSTLYDKTKEGLLKVLDWMLTCEKKLNNQLEP